MTGLSKLIEGRLATAIAGLVFVTLVLGLSILGVAYGFGVFSTSTTVTAVLPQAGPALGPGSEVQYRGVLVGSLGSLRREPNHAVLTMDLQPDKLHQIPADVTVRLVPRSVFGDLYVDLVPPARRTGSLQAGAVLRADTSTPTVELDQALDAGYQLLTAVQPSKLDATLTAISTALHGRGAELGALVNQVSHYSTEVTPHTAQLIHDVTTIGTVGRELSTDAPNLLRTLDDAIATSQTVAGDQPTLSKVLDAGPGVADGTGTLLAQNRAKLNSVTDLLKPVVGVLGAHNPELIQTVRQLHAFTDGAARALGQGPDLAVDVTPDVTTSQGDPYTAADCPRYAGLPGRNCPGQPAKKAMTEGVVAAVIARDSGATSTAPSSPSVLAALNQRIAIADVLLAPVLRSVGGLLK